MMNWNALHDRLLQAAPSLELRRDEPMSRHTTFRVGGPAALMALPRTVGETKAVLKAAYELNIDPFFLGNGSNLLVSGSGKTGGTIQQGGSLRQRADGGGGHVPLPGGKPCAGARPHRAGMGRADTRNGGGGRCHECRGLRRGNIPGPSSGTHFGL